MLRAAAQRLLNAVEKARVPVVAQGGERFEAACFFTVDPSSLLGLRLGGYLHDLGKIAVPPPILNKRGRLTPDEWAAVKRPVLEGRLGDGYILFGEWLYARHSVHYRRLPHYFFEFDIYDKQAGAFLDLERRLALLDGTRIETVPVRA